MHFCQDELNAILALLPFIGTAWFALRGLLHRLTRKPPIPTSDCSCDQEHRSSDEKS